MAHLDYWENYSKIGLAVTGNRSDIVDMFNTILDMMHFREWNETDTYMKINFSSEEESNDFTYEAIKYPIKDEIEN